MVRPTTSAEIVYNENFILKQNPGEDLAFGFCAGFPNEFSVKVSEGSQKLCFVGRFDRENTIVGPLPSN
jgi:hypothetical protein